MLNANYQKLCNKKKFQSFSVFFLRGVNLVIILYILEVVIYMQKEIEVAKKDAKCIRGDIEDMERGIYKKIDQSMAWIKEHFIQVLKSTLNPDVPVTGEFYIFGLYFNFNIVITL